MMGQLDLSNLVSRRDFLEFTAKGLPAIATLSGTLSKIYQAYAQSSVQQNDSTSARIYRFEATVWLLGFISVPYPPLGGVLETTISGATYNAEIMVFHRGDDSRVYYAQKSHGTVVEGRLKPTRSEIQRHYPEFVKPFPIYKHDRNVFDFEYADNRLVNVKRHEKNYAGKFEKNHPPNQITEEVYQSSTDTLTAIMQTLADIKSGKKPDKVYIIGIKGIPRLGHITINGLRVTVKADVQDREEFHFGSTTIDLDTNYEPARIEIKSLLGIANLEGKVQK
ncbi:MAG: hypothetical protein AABX78_00545 [Nanoarchaeota archaeon]